MIEADDPLLADGFHMVEPDNLFRWTDGDAGLLLGVDWIARPLFARRTTRMAGIVRLYGHAAGGRPSERLLALAKAPAA